MRRGFGLLQAGAVVLLLAYAAQAAGGLGGAALDDVFDAWVYSGLIVCAAVLCLARAAIVRLERAAWLAIGLGVLSWAAAEVHYAVFLANLAVPPYPSIGDALFLAFYPLSYVGLILLVRARLRDFPSALWLDGVVAALAIGAVGALALGPIVEETGGSALAVATDLAYPLGDLVLLAIVGATFALAGWRPGRAWGFIGAGLATAALGDAIFLYLSAQGAYEEGMLSDALWPAATLLVAHAAWQRPGRIAALRIDGWRVLAIPSAFAVVALAILLYDHLETVSHLPVGLAALTLLAVIARMAMTFRDNLRMLGRSRDEALTDALTAMGNRRRLMMDLENLYALDDWRVPRTLVIFDLDGFKRYNDAYGHPAGDALLARLGGRLGMAVDGDGVAYRLGGDEFCILVTPRKRGVDAVVAAAGDALADSGTGFDIRASEGRVLIPTEAEGPAEALQIADRRLYEHKAGGARSADGRQARDALLAALEHRAPAVRGRGAEVAALARAVARRLGLPAEDVEMVAQAAELCEIGKLAMPDAVLEKPGKLDAVEWALVREHPGVAERILAAAPALAPVARVVGAIRERYDGSGYPDGLVGEAIPLGARIVAACDALYATTSPRPYGRAMEPHEALAELRRCAGRQFDARAVAALADELAARGAWESHAGRRELLPGEPAIGTA
ncbi:MAG: diguanylate cyclase [Actinomycetota bacterium]|nr:diguanylate cyclase [Actinomycetota bacterium]